MLKSETTTDDWDYDLKNRKLPKQDIPVTQDINMEDNFVTIHKKVYNDLLNETYFLSCLRKFGVDNWEGYDEAISEYYGENDESECYASTSKQMSLFPEEK